MKRFAAIVGIDTRPLLTCFDLVLSEHEHQIFGNQSCTHTFPNSHKIRSTNCGCKIGGHFRTVKIEEDTGVNSKKWCTYIKVGK